MGGRLGKNCEKLQREIWVEMGQDKKEKIMGAGQSKEIPKASPLGCVMAHGKDVAGQGGTENQKLIFRIRQGLVAFIEIG